MEEKITEEKKEKKEVKKDEKKKKKVNEEVLSLTEEVASLKEKNLRLQAEMQNFRRRQEEELARIKKYKNEEILKSLLQILDNFDRAISFKNEENAEIFKGFEMIRDSIINLLKDNEVEEIECVDADFDPNVHQAIMTEHKDGVEAGKIIEILQKGYKYKDRTLRPAMVKVSE